MIINWGAEKYEIGGMFVMSWNYIAPLGEDAAADAVVVAPAVIGASWDGLSGVMRIGG